MRLTHFSISNHSGIPDLDIEIRDHLVIVGPNESGKSSLLRLLDAVLAGGAPRLYTVIDAEALRDLENQLEVEVTFEPTSHDDQVAFADEMEAIGDGNYRLRLRVTASVEPASDEVAIERTFVKPGFSKSAGPSSLQDLGWTFLPAWRSPDRELGSGRSSALRALLKAVELGDSRQEIKDAIDELHKTIAGAAPLERLRDQLASSLQELFPRAVQAEDLVLELPSSAEEDPLADVDVKLKDVDSARSLRHQSDGVRAMSTVALQLMANPTRHAIAVDEPETHLHPLAQRRVGRLLREMAGQALIATHSADVLTEFDPMDVIALTGADRCRQLTVAPFADDRKASLRWWSAPALDPLTARAIILVEGVTDQAIVKTVAEKLRHDLDRLGITVVALDGAGGFKMALRLFGSNGFHVPHWGLVDAREASDVASYLGVSEAVLDDHGFVVCVEDLEDECVKNLGRRRHAELLCASGIFKEAQICSANGVDTFDELQPDRYSAWCRNNKSSIAVALGDELSEADAGLLTPIRAVVEDAVSFVGS